MRLLLDTCVALWMFEGSPRISEKLRDALTDPVNELFFSIVSALEVMIKHQLGKLPMKESPAQLLPEMVEAHGLTMIGLDFADVFELERLPMLHRDPFDRLLVAQARARKWTLVSPDPLIAQYKVPLLWE